MLQYYWDDVLFFFLSEMHNEATLHKLLNRHFCVCEFSYLYAHYFISYIIVYGS